MIGINCCFDPDNKKDVLEAIELSKKLNVFIFSMNTSVTIDPNITYDQFLEKRKYIKEL